MITILLMFWADTDQNTAVLLTLSATLSCLRCLLSRPSVEGFNCWSWTISGDHFTWMLQGTEVSTLQAGSSWQKFRLNITLKTCVRLIVVFNKTFLLFLSKREFITFTRSFSALFAKEGDLGTRQISVLRSYFKFNYFSLIQWKIN